MNLGKIDAVGFYSSNVRQYEASTQSFSGPLPSPQYKIIQNQCSVTEVIVCGWANGQDGGKKSPLATLRTLRNSARCYFICLWLSVASISCVLREYLAHGSFVVGTTGCI